jgi:heme exporter protein C
MTNFAPLLSKAVSMSVQINSKPSLIKQYWWKILGILLVFYTIFAGLLGEVPRLDILNETIRNLYFHVTMWFGMMALLFMSMVHSIQQLNNNSMEADNKASAYADAGILLGMLGILTGSVWARFTWGAWWVNDPKLNGAAISLLIYFAYLILRGAIDEEQKRARIAAVYNIFAFVMLIVFLMIYPRMNNVDSLHPGNGGNPAFAAYDLDARMRMVFYPAVIGWILIGAWIAQIISRMQQIKRNMLFRQMNLKP